tara:strand:- start:4034 stop:4492 length:459 start_codon:yes stop_codon:yes gene_type:complete
VSQGIYAALTHLEDQIMAITPKSDTHHGFVCYDRANGYVTPPAQRHNNNRYFQLTLSAFPEDDGAAGLSGRRRVEVDCEVRYDVSQADPLNLQRMAAEDAEYILERLKGPNYNLSTTGILSVIPQAAIFGPVDLGDMGFMLTVPFTLLYLEA